jgi:hypothetical protein
VALPGNPLDARVGEQERDAAEAELRRQFVAGRLRPEELEERLEVAGAAVTRGDLLRVLHDLPGAARRVVLASGRERRRHVVRRFDRAAIRVHGATYAGVNGGAVTVWALLGAGAFWPAAVLVPTTLLLGGHVTARRRVRRAVRRRRLDAGR